MLRGPLVVALAVASGSVPALAQVHVEWTARHASADGRHEEARALAVDPSGAVFVAGESRDALGADGTLFVAKYGNDGSLVWTRTYDGPLGGAETAYAAGLDGSGDLYVAGVAAEPVHTTRTQKLLLKYAADGTLLWARQFARAADGSTAYAMALDGDHRILLTGSSVGRGLLLAAVDDHGRLLWETVYDVSGHEGDIGRSLAIAPGGDIVVVGSTGLPVQSVGLIARFDSNGSPRWVREIQDLSNPYGDAVSVAVDAAGTAYVALTASDDASGGAGIIAAAAFDADGNALWFRTLPGTAHQGWTLACGIALDPFGRVVVGGSGAATYASITDAAVGVFERDGAFVWSRLLDDPGGTGSPSSREQVSSLRVDGAGNIWLAGTTGPFFSYTQADLFAVQYDPQGVLRCSTTSGLPPVRGWSYDAAYAAELASPDGLVAAGIGQSEPGDLGKDAFVVRWSRTAHAFCFGDGVAAACPCGNASAPVDVAGCRNSSGAAARLVDRGASSLAADTLELVGSSLTGTRAIFFQGTADSPVATYGDGLRCAGGALVRLGVAPIEAGAARFPGTGDPRISARGGVAATGSRNYQIAYRDATGACGGTSSNLSNALRVEWIP